ncbi:hypothetical protein [Stutzerimonas kirkiae]|uniref:hypothetical protein n=1 Tax=Stutzerimonas kirkiae TaxID=2211392 RepID=UPI00103856D4|nr:hypothetical protein [Stutzerimonas kirkiae]TBV05860.1 hypothetical protein DNK08_15285 [Stutzerimonas kirkiae]TBV12924.1 hypothetical protein DNK01_13465 [Stutzerimonas kirkiae]
MNLNLIQAFSTSALLALAALLLYVCVYSWNEPLPQVLSFGSMQLDYCPLPAGGRIGHRSASADDDGLLLFMFGLSQGRVGL